MISIVMSREISTTRIMKIIKNYININKNKNKNNNCSFSYFIINVESSLQK